MGGYRISKGTNALINKRKKVKDLLFTLFPAGMHIGSCAEQPVEEQHVAVAQVFIREQWQRQACSICMKSPQLRLFLQNSLEDHGNDRKLYPSYFVLFVCRSLKTSASPTKFPAYFVYSA
ncbi:uncharacterized protein LOC123204464 [Mangifera indica]|uniref:uncharacterized protein LOC123204464 n=1 Tax=Mangifera indica TaxID=29780 RepID=UPI001CFAB966|nr:uncharacterized protein LOC123204464 [Mangifera indica]